MDKRFIVLSIENFILHEKDSKERSTDKSSKLLSFNFYFYFCFDNYYIPKRSPSYSNDISTSIRKTFEPATIKSIHTFIVSTD